MRAAILAIGDELTLGQTLDTNSRWIAARLTALSVLPVEHRTVADDRASLAAAIGDLARDYDFLVMTGGLGPTLDDLVREALGDVISPGAPLRTDPDALARLDRWFGAQPGGMPEGNARQAQHPEGATLLDNHAGTAPGLVTLIGTCRVTALPGPPAEMHAMFEDHVRPVIEETLGETPLLATRAVHAFGIGESRAAELLGELIARDRDPLVGTTASRGILTARLRTARAGTAGLLALDEMTARINAAWRPYAYGADEATLSSALLQHLRRTGETVAVAESCTGGALAKAIVDVPGASDVFAGGWVTYSNEMKTRCLDVPPESIETRGAVSPEVAAAMARGAVRHADADYAIATSGIAGPGGGTEAKPVGTVIVAVAVRAPDVVTVRRFRFRGDRDLIRERSVPAALQMLRFALLERDSIGEPEGGGTASPLIWERSTDADRGWTAGSGDGRS